jgi:GntR family transcriptional regulator
MRHQQSADAATLNSISPLPFYYQLQTIIQNDIENGRLKPGDAILPERKLAERYKVSVGTVRQAIAPLVNEGLLIRMQGRGTYVTGTTMDPDYVRSYRFPPDFTEAEAPITFTFKSLKKVAGHTKINACLKIAPGQDLFELKRLMLIDDEPTAYSISYLPQRIFKRLNETPASRFEKIALYRIIEQTYGLPTISRRELFSVSAADKEVAAFLHVELGSPVLLIEMVAYSHKERAYEFRKSFCTTRSRRLLREY